MGDLKGMVGLVCIAVLAIAAVVAPYLSPYDPTAQSLRLRNMPPGTRGEDGGVHWLGTDQVGRDVLSRLLHGARVSLIVSVAAVGWSGTAGTLLGVLSGFHGRAVDAVLMRIADVQLAFPMVLLAIAWVAFLGTSLVSVIAVIGISGWVSYARVSRGLALSLREEQFVEAAQALGSSSWRIVTRHILPNVTSAMVVIATLQLGRAVLLESTLSFLGLGVQPPTPTWGGMLADGRPYLDTAWWVATFPGIAIMVLVLGANLTGDSLRDFLDPRLAQRGAPG
ncbi:MAG: ABC transporter permease [Armatimonadetes bacterium]|nr:ABC transporter permease [Armatimonadota bacterium]